MKVSITYSVFFYSKIAGPMHAMLLFRVCEDAFNCFLTFSKQRSIHICMSEILYFVHRFLPKITKDDTIVDITGYHNHP